MRFIKSKWRNLILANFIIDPSILLPHLPKGTTLDFHEGNCYLSLVAFLFQDTRILGLPIPYHINFEEVNLRFYVKPDYDPSVRAVVFIKEIVPKKAIELVANTFFKEHYMTTKMRNEMNSNFYSYSWLSDKKWQKVSIEKGGDKKLPDSGSITEFITEHYWGYTKDGDATFEYEVRHPQWEICQAMNVHIDVDFESTYGREFAFLTAQVPDHVCFAEGSEVEVMTPRRI